MKSRLQNFHFFSWPELGYQQFLSKRNGEVRLGEQLIDVKQAKFVILGIEESVGPRVNLGAAGAEQGFKAFCAKFLNMQSTNTLVGDNIAFLGGVRSLSDVPAKEDMIEELDGFVSDVIDRFISQDQVLIVIGGGHNNAFPIINSKWKSLTTKLNVVNLDAHADYRALEGRHSGNPFSYAMDQGFLEKYFVLGLHQRYNNLATLNGLLRDKHYFTFFEDYIDRARSFYEDIDFVAAELKSSNFPFGIELDMDAIENMPSSAVSPSGFSMNEARFYIRKMAKIEGSCYFHIPEAAPKSEQEALLVGKAISYLVSDFISCHPLSDFQRISS
jgi:formiminoglutamase